ncbi:unnamed protein product [Allacma fusca]|uniref:Spaetzle domain-containing protein n=1 Tax=Allacma fusca TaxID=39272 RepID=A0A8J2KIT3_9HEXA|nr:unnamed protein product [Allacma fusca]
MAKKGQIMSLVLLAPFFLLISPYVNGQPFLNSLAVLFRARPPWPTTFPSAKFTPIPPPLLNPPGSSQGILVAHPISPSSSTAYESINDGLKSKQPDTIESVQSVQSHPQSSVPSPQQNFISVQASPTISPLIPIYPPPIPLFQNGHVINHGPNNGVPNSGNNNQHINSKDSAVYQNTLPSTLIASPTTLQGSYALPDAPTTVSNPNYGVLLENAANSKGSQKKSKFRGNAWKPVTTSSDLNRETKNSLQGNLNDGNDQPKNSNKENTRQLKNIKEFRPSPQLNSYLETTLISDYGSHINANNGYSGHYDGSNKDAQDNPGFHPTNAKTPKLESGFRPISFDQYASNYGSTATSQHYTNSHQQYYNPWSIPFNGNNPQQNPESSRNPKRDNNDNAARDTRGDTHDSRDTRQDSRNTGHDSRDTGHDSRDTRHDSRDTRQDSRDTRQDSRDTRQDSRDTRYDSRDTRQDSRDNRPGTRDATSSTSKGPRRNKPFRQDRQIVTGSVSVSMKNSGEDESHQEGSSSEEDSQRFFRTRGKKKSSAEQLSKKKPRHRLSSKGKWDHGISSTTASSELVEDWLPPGIQIQKKSDNRKKAPIYTDIKPVQKPKPLPQGTFKLPEKCEKFNRFGFCPVTKQYPLDAAEKIASRCTALMSHLIAPLPKMDVQYDVAKKAQNPNGVTVKRPTGWSWRSFNGKPVCDTDELAILPGWARNEKGDWMIILQTKVWQQKAHISLCSPMTVPCQGQACSTNPNSKPPSPGRSKNDEGQEAKKKNCVQRFSAQRLAVFDPDNPDRCPVVHSVFLPSACVCLTSGTPTANDQGSSEGDKQSYGQNYSRFSLRQPLFSSDNDELMQASEEEDMVGSYRMDSPESGTVTIAPMTQSNSDTSSERGGKIRGSIRHQSSNSIEDPRNHSGTFMVITKKFSTSESSKETSDMPQGFMAMNETQRKS